ncbi:SLC5/6 family protein [Aerococcus sanguinicola]|uniref:sodium:solute symporter n=1 Tax=unclassified Aerococcus TaxID=2618060 RepID=UPI0008A36B54|nr:MULTISPECIES: sodium:solute symporter [unclassified Aerococcus]KAB0646531.1 sodium:solute symporter [Aerococcus sanguinicola]MDK6233805.1 hypothetical protein [Aerococcus sp. UMB10185]MDK6855885.1 hypothetical protein [Aerococcus sp. UMB7533]OFN03946.1 sodium:solute symporter [Aerococcus sp. HMSC062A02]OHO43497.1 sodium:solute symporter [Aerococcus sp. HMSC035B07]
MTSNEVIWAFLTIYAILMFLLSPKFVDFSGYFRGTNKEGKDSSLPLLTATIFISWIFAKSVTNAANLGAQYGIVGGFAYATYWLCIPLAGFVIYRLRKKFGAKGIIPFLNHNYGPWAGIFFTLAIFTRLFNEIWSNTSVVGGYFGASGSTPFILASVIFSVITLAYSVRGGLRSAIVTDMIQSIIFIIFMVAVFALVLPNRPMTDYVQSGNWTLLGGVDMLLVSAVQIFSYPFHDPVLTDRGFISDEKKMLKAFIIAGLAGFVSIVLFSFVGIYAKMEGMALTDNIPVAVAQSLGTAALVIMAGIMVSSAGSTLDSALSSIAKLSAIDVPHLLGIRLTKKKTRFIAMLTMVLFAILGNLPMFFGTSILSATTISGTMVMGFAPIFCLHGFVPTNKWSFQLSFWIGIIIGLLYTFGLVPSIFAIGAGDSALLLGTNVYGLILCTLGYLLPGLLEKFQSKGVE